ncbi:hypothetical protein RSJ2_954 [Clostridium botulinum]|uniref:hypothetical protein n=1 Tax=Clostridium botulinum TaxID=1491 RepID=UPI0004B4E26D|nr:hypothetical protein [Clostridium botulinum]APR01682.1 hypothetical protein RSJ2_954 [Clostridium botulinum]BDB00845.1 hypothetical protein CBOS2020_09190 [Clostridium botulinum]
MLNFFVICFLETGNDEKNIKSFESYPDEIQSIIINNDRLKNKIVTKNPHMSFISNVFIFSIVLFLCEFIIRTGSWKQNFFNILILGEVLNAFDFFFIDMIWWRNTERVRFKGTEKLDSVYKNPKKHIRSFLKGIVVFVIVALIDTIILFFI